MEEEEEQRDEDIVALEEITLNESRGGDNDFNVHLNIHTTTGGTEAATAAATTLTTTTTAVATETTEERDAEPLASDSSDDSWEADVKVELDESWESPSGTNSPTMNGDTGKDRDKDDKEWQSL